VIARRDRLHTIQREQRLDVASERAFDFFGDALNLETITPPWLRFRVVTPGPITMQAGALIEYRLRIHGLPVRWKTRIESWEPPHRFVDVQLSGPYKRWEHTHTFEAIGDDAVLMTDRVDYELPLGPAGRIARKLFVARDLDRIFAHRHAAVAARLASALGA
jgi:ligand-binding SRPBCC domain-containing protein